MTIEVSEYVLHFRRQDMNPPTRLIYSIDANSLSLLEKPAFLVSLDEDECFLLVFIHGTMSNVKILPKLIAKFIPTVVPCLHRMIDFEVSDNIERWITSIIPAFQTR